VPEAVSAAIRVVSRTSPRREFVEVYQRLYPLYRGLYGALKPTFDALV
jgi:sugar (pentulose or hexulose) kinase